MVFQKSSLSLLFPPPPLSSIPPCRLLDPIFQGDYPAVMRERAGDRLPRFSEEERDMLRGSVDFVGLNHYTTKYVAQASGEGGEQREAEGNHMTDQGADVSRKWLGYALWLHNVRGDTRTSVDFQREWLGCTGLCLFHCLPPSSQRLPEKT